MLLYDGALKTNKYICGKFKTTRTILPNVREYYS